MQKVSKKMESVLVLAALTVLVFGAAMAQAATVEATTEIFKQLDVDNDGYVTSGDALTVGIASEAFVAADRDQDGKLSLEEFASANKGEAETKQP